MSSTADTPHPSVRAYDTPFKLGRPVLGASGRRGAFDERAVDSPFVFWHEGRYRMLYIGFDGTGYRTALAHSDDLLVWEHDATVLGDGVPGRWDGRNAAGVWLLRENDVDRPRLRCVDGRYWMVYHSYPDDGYEAGPASIGLAWSTDRQLREWHRLPEPILTPAGEDDWEAGGLYKGALIQHENVYHLYYNAKTRPHADGTWREQIGVATSNDLRSWHRYAGNPVVANDAAPWTTQFASDPFVVCDGEDWVMFLFGVSGDRGRDGVARSRDLRHWTLDARVLIDVGGAGEIDAWHAHKPSLLRHDGQWYHFYTAVRPARPDDRARNGAEVRAITVARSAPWE